MALDISSLWDHSQPELSERRFRDALAGASADDALILQTQIARTHGIRKDFARAQEILATIKDAALQASAEVRVRYFLELGRTHSSATHSPQSQTPQTQQLARAAYTQAFEIARQARLDDLGVDALHMMAFVDTEPKAQLEWDMKALEYLEGSAQPAAKQWEGSLRNNVGYALHLLGRYDEALAQFNLSLAAYARAGRARNVRIAHWMIAWTLRAQGKFAQAVEIQLRLEREWEQAGEPDPYVFEELEHLYRALHDADRASVYAEKLRKAKPPR